MIYHSSEMNEEQVSALIGLLESSAYLSRRDGCKVAMVSCAGCKASFEEELEEAKAKAVSSVPFLCLACDKGASKPAFRSLSIHMVWFLG